jgi:hypothetical protein
MGMFADQGRSGGELPVSQKPVAEIADPGGNVYGPQVQYPIPREPSGNLNANRPLSRAFATLLSPFD